MIRTRKGLEIETIQSQLKRADLQKKKLIENIYKEYFLYLEIVRDSLLTSVEKGINVFCSDSTFGNFIQDSIEPSSLFKKKISNLIYSQLPLITVEQLKVIDFDNDITEEINLELLDLSESKSNQKEYLESEDDYFSEELLEFNINGNISNTFEYYESTKNENLLSINFDNKEYLNYSQDHPHIGNLVKESQFANSLLELIEEENIDNSENMQNLSKSQNNFSVLNQDVRTFDLIDNALNKLLLNLSYKINLELFKSKLINKIISEDTFNYLSNKKFMIKNPYPFIISFDLNTNQLLKSSAKLPNISFLHISTVELEFKNLNLSMRRNKINELRFLFQGLIKKEIYWRQKEINLNKM